MENTNNLYKSILIVAGVTALILLVPLIAMQFTDEVNWSVSDFIIMGVLLFVTGLSYVLVTRSGGGIAYKTAMALAIGSGFLLIWVNLAVGLIGAGPNLGNLLYIAVLAVGITGSVLSGFTPTGMERAMYATAFTLLLLAVIALLIGMHEYPGSSVPEIIGVNGFFAALFAVAGLIFRSAGRALKVDSKTVDS